MSIRIAAIEVSHWHSLYDSAYLRHLARMPDVQLIDQAYVMAGNHTLQLLLTDEPVLHRLGWLP